MLPLEITASNITILHPVAKWKRDRQLAHNFFEQTNLNFSDFPFKLITGFQFVVAIAKITLQIYQELDRFLGTSLWESPEYNFSVAGMDTMGTAWTLILKPLLDWVSS